MHKLVERLIIIALSLFYPLSSYALEVLGYIYRGDSILHLVNDDIIQQNTSLKSHIKHINVIAPQAYQINERGTVWGNIDPLIVRLSENNNVELMPLVTNSDFDSERTHIFLNDPVAQKRAIEQLVLICNAHHFYGFQIDFEHILITDKDAYTHFYQHASQALHAANFKISAAIFPRTSDNNPTTDRSRSSLEYWSGGYDYAALSKDSEFVTLMAYDQHGGGTTPGSACEPSWVENIIKYALQYIPANKISIGLPVKSAYWYTSSGHSDFGVKETDLTYPQLQYLIEKFNIKTHWDSAKKLSYSVFVNNNLNEFIYAEDKPTFQVKVDLAHKYKLRGVSLWRVGTEDPAIWELL